MTIIPLLVYMYLLPTQWTRPRRRRRRQRRPRRRRLDCSRMFLPSYREK